MAEKKKYNKEENLNLFNQFREQNPDLVIEFPLYLKNKRPDGISTLFWRYHINGKYELISFGKFNNSFTYGENEYWKGADNLFENLFILKQIHMNDYSSEDEFIEKMKELFSKHSKFIGSQEEYKEEENNSNTIYKKVQKENKGKLIEGNITIKVDGEEDPF